MPIIGSQTAYLVTLFVHMGSAMLTTLGHDVRVHSDRPTRQPQHRAAQSSISTEQYLIDCHVCIGPIVSTIALAGDTSHEHPSPRNRLINVQVGAIRLDNQA
ncbi:hypothetical protein T440DRAFT_471848 [Plenodomus tracheiphilus IPT5]|uniref:Secreted protein n=1 Tax=Plenodomus tracheiphilus IPT5 TaxID=1408161 RepID=A0A6A7AT09_9PLEO|nr:hypothetical protein T440DRAFT_471848 [Plenodomus tracheiphilus IPT5]